MMLFLLVSLILPIFISGFSLSSAPLRLRALSLSTALAILLRLISISTVCREEQHPYCHVTFYSSSTRPVSPTPMVLLSFPIAYYLPVFILRGFLAPSKSDKGGAPMFINTLWKICLLVGTIYWLMEWSESVFVDAFSFEWTPSSLTARTILARLVLGGIAIGGYSFWWYAPLNVEMRKEDADGADVASSAKEMTRVVILGYANVYGSMYLMFVLPFFGLICLGNQLTGQVVLSLGLVGIMCFVELVDTLRDSWTLRAS